MYIHFYLNVVAICIYGLVFGGCLPMIIESFFLFVIIIKVVF